jgi:hypothetical protein
VFSGCQIPEELGFQPIKSLILFKKKSIAEIEWSENEFLAPVRTYVHFQVKSGLPPCCQYKSLKDGILKLGSINFCIIVLVTSYLAPKE